MATLPPLEFDIKGFEGYKAPSNGGVGAAASRAAFEEEVLRRSRQRLLATAAPEILSSAGVSVPVGEAAAPVAAAAAKAAPSFGARLMSMGAGAARVGGAASLALPFGIAAGELLTPEKVAVGAADALGTLGAKLGIKSLAQYAGGVQQYDNAQAAPAPVKVSDITEPATAPAQSSSAPSYENSRIVRLPSGSEAARAASSFIDSTGVPADGTGFIRNESTGAVTVLDSRGAPPPSARKVIYTQPTESPDRPRLGTEGGIFANLANYVNDFGDFSIASAQRNRATKTALKTRELDTAAESKDVASQVALQNADSNRLKAIADLFKEQTAAARENKTVTPGVDGNSVIITDKKTNTAVKVNPTERPTLEKFITESRKDPRNRTFTDAQLRQEYAKRYGG